MSSIASSPETWSDPAHSPHCSQIYLNHPRLDFAIDPPFCRILDDSHPHRPYQRRIGAVKSTLHWGQRKLLLSEIEFLTILGCKALIDSTIVYAGAAPGTHISFLSALFPSARFILVDPAPFTVRASDKIQIINDLFTDALASSLSLAHQNIYFISDIRTADPFVDSPSASEEKIRQDMRAQMEWHALLKSQRSMLKFRLPWDNLTSTYLAGEIRLPVWGPQTTTESRLITDPDPSKTRLYDHEKYEGQMFHFNTTTRHSLYPHPILGEGLDHCYDCRAEIEILSNYLSEFAFPSPHIPSSVSSLSAKISRHIAFDRTLLDPTPDKEERLRRIKRRQSPNGIPPHSIKTRRIALHSPY